MAERKRSSINGQSNLILARTDTDGAGAFSSPLQQQGVRGDSGTADGWSFTTDGTNGQLDLDVEDSAAGGFVTVQAKTSGTGAYVAEAVFVGTNTIRVTVRAPATGAAINLATTVVQVDVIAGLADG